MVGLILDGKRDIRLLSVPQWTGFIWTQSEELITAKREDQHHHHHHHHFTDSIMKTLCFTLGLLLLTACCCNAMPKAAQFSTAPGRCCFNFYTRGLPVKRVSNITKTHSSCLTPAFIVQTVRGKQVCYSQTFQWAVNIYNQLHNTEGSGQQL